MWEGRYEDDETHCCCKGTPTNLNADTEAKRKVLGHIKDILNCPVEWHKKDLFELLHSCRDKDEAFSSGIEWGGAKLAQQIKEAYPELF
jgi:hypothetical protein